MKILEMITSPLWLVIGALVLSLVPIVIGLATSYLKMSIVIGMLRQGVGAQQVPGNLVVAVLSMAMTMLVMGPVLSQSVTGLNKVLESNQENFVIEKALPDIFEALKPWKEFLITHSGEREKNFVKQLSKTTNTDQVDSVTESKDIKSVNVLLSFILTELKDAFSMAVVTLLPFLVIDIVVSNLLVGLGMYMVSPVMITLPLKLLVFVLCDGWMLLTRGLIVSYGTI